MTKSAEQIRALALSLTLVIAAGAIGVVSEDSGVVFLLAPGMLLGALLFAEGAHSDWPSIYVVAALVIDVVLYMIPILWLLRRRDRLVKLFKADR